MAKPKNDLKRITFWMSAQKMKDLMKIEKRTTNASELIRGIIEAHIERSRSEAVHRSMYGKLTDKDFDLRFF
jgi:hypothetical protein